ncbi:MAG: hypothetical protein HUJ93_01660 [Bacteroidales bacterium]|nr:hypothetical protein [Bacteroidales bacterium]
MKDFNGKLVTVNAAESAMVLGGVDKYVKDVFYYIGYIIGKILSLFKKKDKTTAE